MAETTYDRAQHDRVADTWEYYATVGSDQDLLVGYPGYDATNRRTTRRAARAFMVAVSGNITVTRDGDGVDETIPVIAGVVYPLRITALKTTGTTATGVIVMW